MCDETSSSGSCLLQMMDFFVLVLYFVFSNLICFVILACCFPSVSGLGHTGAPLAVF